MQTLTDMALKVIRWDAVILLNGVYRISNASLLTSSPNVAGFTERIHDGQFCDELNCAKGRLGLYGGLWYGISRDAGRYNEVMALLLE